MATIGSNVGRLRRFKLEGRCKTCQYTLDHKRFHDDLLNTTYFDPNGFESIPELIRRFKVNKSLGYRNVMYHVTHHVAPVQKHNEIIKAEAAAAQKVISEKELAQAIAVPTADTEYERALDTTIEMYHQQLKTGKLKLTVNTGLQAIKTKAEIESKNRDRKLDFLKAFSAMGQKNAE